MEQEGANGVATEFPQLFTATAADLAAWEKWPDEATQIPASPARSTCTSRKCNRPVWRGLTKRNRVHNAFDFRPDGSPTGTSHWRTCLDKERFKRPKPAV
jgi:hypothetical protein